MKIVSLNKARKARSKAEKRVQADANAVKFGRTKAQKDVQQARDAKARRDLAGHKRET